MEKLKVPENFDHDAHAIKAKAIYEQEKEALEEKFKGYYAAVHVDSSEIFVGKNQIQAYYAALKKHPNSFFFFIRIGLPPVKKRGIYRKKKKV